MREVTKSLTSFSWVMTLFGLQQTLRLFSRPNEQQLGDAATQAFDNVTKATRQELSEFTETAFRAGDRIQRGLLDMVFEWTPPGDCSPCRGSESASRGFRPRGSN